MALLVVTHGGTSSDFETERDGPRRAADEGLRVLRDGGNALDAAVAACAALEDDPRFNAGTGSNLRFDGRAIEMDAACMWSERRRFGAVAALRRVKNPVLVARAVSETPHVLLAGEGALRFARCLGFEDHDPWTERAQKKHDRLRDQLRLMDLDPSECQWTLKDLERYWNFETPLKSVAQGSDTVGAVATEGRTWAAALSTGGTMGALLGRVGDVPLPGCGLHVHGNVAVACTGNGDELARWQLASRVHRFMQEGMTARQAVKAGVEMLPADVDAGIVALKGHEHAAHANTRMAWAVAQEGSP